MTHQAPLDDQAASVSFNFSVFKVLSILGVALSHWPISADLPTWIPGNIGLVIFAFSSGMFTAQIYGVEVDVATFWRKKIERLAVRYWFLLAFVAVLLLAEGRTVFHWHSLVHVFGLSGFLNLFGHSVSSLGAGLWFFTLLLLFYVAYPYLARLTAASRGDYLLPLAATLFFFYLNDHVILPISLWLTMLGFILGVFGGMYGTRTPARVSLALTVGALGLLLVANVALGYKTANADLIGLASVTACLWLMRARLPQWTILRGLARLENCLLEIFIIHTYLFIHPTGISALDFVITMTFVVAVAWVLNGIANRLVKLVFGKPGAQRQAVASAKP